MGSYSSIKINNYEFAFNKNGFYEELAGKIFLSEDYRERNIFDGNNHYKEKTLEVTVKIAKQRLEIFGASIEKAKRDYEIARENENEYGIIDNQLCFQDYQNFIKEVFDTGYNNQKYEDCSKDSNFRKLFIELDFCVEGQSESLWFYSILSSIDDNYLIKYDLTWIIEGGWIGKDFFSKLEIPKITILTEGKTDSEFIKKGIDILYPQIFNYYKFIDFDKSKYSGGASQLVNIVKSFIGTGLKDFTIALFDNDTAGSKEIENLKKIDIPNNIKILQYPNIELAMNYPTINFSEKSKLNVNGIAGSIEMYLGNDVLKDGDDYIPVKLHGYEEKIRKYQGVLQRKDIIQKRFRKKVKDFKGKDFNQNDWNEMDILIKMIMNVWKN